MISKRIMGDIQKEKWTSALQMAEHYHNTRKLENKHKDERQSDSAE
jgi:hypothetical protein